MDSRVAKLINEQINKELYSAYLYMSFANYYEEAGLKGFANWYMTQVQEERDHALIFRNYLLDNDVRVELGPIEGVEVAFDDPLAPLEAALEHEEFITASINQIYAAADEVHDYRTMNFLKWFIDEQLEEEANARDMVSDMKLYGKDQGSLFAMDREAATRTYTKASPLAAAE
ncbi:ferritin [Eggerthellaceae bacterium zg-1084]|uniref:ferritin n=1 Tax=Berryella wangjianweii TaxID=2734634 RepID=UPI001556D05D|nr:ferritin [Berryella wangjianweii]NPD31527.1 ferritin [Berryella wangjianweii]NPD32978.1 ferritin [Eggerthellaceae bacterium zg-997]